MYSFVKKRKKSEEFGRALGDVGFETPPIFEPTAVAEGLPLETTGGIKPIPGTTPFQDGVAIPPGQGVPVTSTIDPTGSKTADLPNYTRRTFNGVPYFWLNGRWNLDTVSTNPVVRRRRKPVAETEENEAESWTDSITNWMKENWIIVAAVVGIGGVAIYFATKKG